ncbi:seryl-tRNA synthetase [Rhizodiscina lignyota]|uniref:serine--tRNA ligase n=1 Tax=Rhizodiscina lignyota TaxID=1504668 RepID=A0A9P4II80_9PEZI|nr:seryl-tRNA synthetase [Rhizodiscina lignyota]
MVSPNTSLFACRSCRRDFVQALKSLSTPRYPRRRTFTRPSNAPKPQPDIRHIRQNPGLYEQNCVDRNYAAQARNSWRIIELFDVWQKCQSSARQLRERNNVVKKSVAKPQEGDAARQALIEEARRLKAELGEIEQKEEELQDNIQVLALELPNLSSVHTPTGLTPEVLSYINVRTNSSGPSRSQLSHTDIGARLNLLDFSAAATTSGWGWYYLLNGAALLEQALVQYALHTCMQRGWRIVSPPSMVYAHMASACGFQPRDQHGETQIYAIEQSEKDKQKSEEGQSRPQYVMAGTAEIPLAGLKANTVLAEEELPLKVVGVSRSYRAEAGARGVDTKGLYRVHEFTKVEMFAWTLPDTQDADGQGNFATGTQQNSHSERLFQEMVELQKSILQPLGLHCRVLSMPSTDLGASATRKIDIEAFFPSRIEKDDGYGEVTSASICTDYQSRRLNTRMKSKAQGGKLEYVHTLNGTAMAIPRVLAAILENGWDEEKQEVRVPEVLRKWMGGMDAIRKDT